MRTNKDRLKALVKEHFVGIKNDITRRLGGSIGNDDWYKSRSIKIYEVVLTNIYSSAIDWISEYDTRYPLAWVRVDIIEKGLAVPVGSDFYGGKLPLPYRSNGDDGVFEILYGGLWVDAQSVDWIFSDPVPEPEAEVTFDKQFRPNWMKAPEKSLLEHMTDEGR